MRRTVSDPRPRVPGSLRRALRPPAPALLAPSLLLALAALWAGGPLAAQTPELGYVFPPVVAAGASTEVQLGGFDFTDDMQFFVHDKAVRLAAQSPPGEFLVPGPPYWFGPKGFSTAWPIPREIEAAVEAPAAAAPGLVRWQVANANGASATGVLLISDRPEVIELRELDGRQEARSVQQLPQLPVAVSGRLGKIAEVDRYRITAAKTGPVTLDLWARRLGADFRAVLEVRDAEGDLVADVADTQGHDPQLTFAAVAGESYSIRLHDVDFRGNRAFVYRLAAAAEPGLVAAMPSAGGGAAELIVDDGRGLRRVRGPLPAAPEGPAAVVSSTTDELPLVDGQQITGPISQPCRIVDTFDGTRRLELDAAKGEPWRIRARSLSLRPTIDLALEIVDGEDKVLASNDDAGGSLDPQLLFRPPADGRYTCVVRDNSGAAPSPASAYQLTLDRPQPDFALTAPQRLAVALGGKAALTVKAERLGGFTGEIAVRLEGLPPGVTVPDGLKIEEKKNSLKVAVEAGAEAAAAASLATITGVATIDGRAVERLALAEAAGNLCARSPGEKLTSSILIATTMKAPVRIALVDKNRQRAVHRGTTYPAPFVIHRDEGFAGEVRLQMAAKQSRHRQGISGPVLTVPPAADEALYPCFLPEWLATDRTTRMSVLGVVRAADPRGNLRTLMAPADARVTMILEGALLKVACLSADLAARPGDELLIKLEIARSTKLAEPVQVTVESSGRLAGRLQPQPLTIPPGRRRAVLRVAIAAVPGLAGDRTILVKATALQDGRWPVVSQVEVPVRFTAGRSGR